MTDMKQATIQVLGRNWLINGLNFDVSQYSKKGNILNVTEMINFANINIVSIVNKDVLIAEFRDKLKY